MKSAMPIVCLTVFLFVLLTGCGRTEAIVTPAPQLQKVTLQLQWVTQTQFAGYYVALDKGWYRDEGIDLTIRPGGPDISPTESVRSGVADFATSLLTDLIVANESANEFISIAQIQQNNGLLLIAKKDSGIGAPRDFVGKKVGVWLGNWEAQFNALIAKENISANDFILTPQGFSMDAFINGDLDVASAMIYNEYYVVLESGISPDALNIIDYSDYGLDFPGDTLFTTKKLLQSDPDLCVRMLRASLRGWQYAIDHPEEAADIVLKYDKSGVQTRQHQISMMHEIIRLVKVGLRPLGYTNRDDVRRVIDTLYTYNVLKVQINPDEVFTNAIWEQAQP